MDRDLRDGLSTLTFSSGLTVYPEGLQSSLSLNMLKAKHTKYKHWGWKEKLLPALLANCEARIDHV